MFKFYNKKLFYKHEKKYSNLDILILILNFNSLKKLDKRLIISGPARNGNHLLISLLDGTKIAKKYLVKMICLEFFTQFKS